MGLLNAFGQGLHGLFGEGFADRAAIASALLDGDGQAVAAIRQHQAMAQAQRQKAEQDQQTMLHAYAALKGMGMSDDQAISIASDPNVSAKFFADRNGMQQFGAAGGSFRDPITGAVTMAPSRHEFQGSVFDVGGGAPGDQAQTTLQHQGVQWITPQPGTTAFGVNSFTGQPMGGDAPQSAPSAGGGDLREQAIDAIRRGADPAKVLQRMQQMMKGGQSGGGSTGGFL